MEIDINEAETKGKQPGISGLRQLSAQRSVQKKTKSRFWNVRSNIRRNDKASAKKLDIILERKNFSSVAIALEHR